jgi:hypothetical protein
MCAARPRDRENGRFNPFFRGGAGAPGMAKKGMDRVTRRSLWLACCSAAALCATGCATTGLAWVHERESGVDLTPPEPPSESAARTAAPSNVTPPNDPIAPPPDSSHRRLDRTITLGGTTESSVQAYDPAPPASDPRGTTIVNVYVNQPMGTPYGAGYGYGYGYASPLVVAPRAAVVRTQAPTALRPGLDWPAVPNRGPAFPYRTGPASPWDGADPRRR